MLKPGGQLDLTLETLGAKRCGKVGMQHLDGDGPIVLDVTRESLDKAIVQCRAGNRLGDISHAVQTHCEGHGFGVVRAFVGHGIGRNLHEEPQIPNFGDAGRGPIIKAGMVLAIEPMVTMGSYEVRVLEDRWTAVTVDGSWAAHFEDTIAITESGPEVLTRLDHAA